MAIVESPHIAVAAGARAQKISIFALTWIPGKDFKWNQPDSNGIMSYVDSVAARREKSWHACSPFLMLRREPISA
jgi:hypothetical protein